MATLDTQITERRHIPDRRGGASDSRAVTHAHRMNAVDWIAMALLIVGGLNWGLVGVFRFDLVATLFGEMSTVSRVVYALVGLSAVYSVYTASKMGAR